MSNDTVDEAADPTSRGEADAEPALVIAWCADPRRVGEVLLVDDTPRVFGRHDADGDETARARLVRQRPGSTRASLPLDLPALSRAQLEVSAARGVIHVRNLGRRQLLDADGHPADALALGQVGSTCEVRGQVVFVRVDRPRKLPLARSLAGPEFGFGESDAHGIVGESACAWALREQCAFVAARSAHVLVLGESGSGKELVAQAIHAASRRGRRQLVARNAATIPTGLADAELFGNLANYPNPGMPERKGLVGEADGSTLFLDEIGELPEELQSRLLRVLDERGEYNRLGEARARTSDLRLIGATNRPISALKHDVAARFRLRLRVPGLGERREDVMLLARHLLRRVGSSDPEIAARFFDGAGTELEPRIAAPLARALVRHTYRTHCRELDALLWRSIATSTGDTLDLTAEVEEDLGGEGDRIPTSSRRDPTELSPDDVRSALARAGGVQERAWRDLGLANRYVLKRLIAKMGLSGQAPDDG